MVLLRCLSFNIWKNEGDYPRRMAVIAALLREHQPDVVALQECFVAPALGINSARALAEVGYHPTCFPARAKLRQHGGVWQASRSDMAILTRDKPVACSMLELPPDQRDGERGLLCIDLPIKSGRIRVGCTHLTHLQDAAAQAVRREQADAVMGALLDGRAAAILMGDLNASSDDPALAPIFDHPLLCRTARELSRRPAGLAPGNGAIDHVLLFAPGPLLRMTSRHVIAAPDPDDPAGGPSDHPAILAEIEVA